jgi:hypothetical protein
VLCLAALAAPAASHQRDCGEPCGEIIAPRAGVRVEIVAGGYPLPVYRDGRYRWIEGVRGQRFAFRISNRNGFPVGVIPSADGQSLTSDGPAAAHHPAYVVEPYGTLEVSVWREDLGGGRELVFTDVDNSLAARKGDRRNIGVLGVLVWQLEEKNRPRPYIDGSERSKSQGGKSGSPSNDSAAAGAEPGIGVGAGGRIDDPAYLTDRFRRVRVMETIAIYYDDYMGLMRAGVNLNQHRGHPRDRRRSDPFPEYRGVRIP